MNLIEGLQDQISRAKKLKDFYDGIPSGSFGSAAIASSIRDAEHYMAIGDTVAMLDAYKRLEAIE